MLLIVSLFMICAIVTPAAGEALRERHRAAQRRAHIGALLRNSPVADYRHD